MSAQRLRRWSNIVQMLYKCSVFAGYVRLLRCCATLIPWYTSLLYLVTYPNSCSCDLHGRGNRSNTENIHFVSVKIMCRIHPTGVQSPHGADITCVSTFRAETTLKSSNQQCHSCEFPPKSCCDVLTLCTFCASLYSGVNEQLVGEGSQCNIILHIPNTTSRGHNTWTWRQMERSPLMLLILSTMPHSNGHWYTAIDVSVYIILIVFETYFQIKD